MKSIGVVLVLLASGCSIDERMIATRPDPIVIDTFESITRRPTDPRFNQWEFTTYNADPEMSDANLVQPGFESEWCLQVDWDVTDMPDGKQNYPGFLARTQALGSIDITGYSRLTFTQLYQHVGVCQPLQYLRVNVGCAELNSSYTANVPVSSAWTTTSISFADLVETIFPAPAGVARDACLKVFDQLQFVTQVDVPDGACASGTLFIDDVTITAD